jgi:hypothetical protein
MDNEVEHKLSIDLLMIGVNMAFYNYQTNYTQMSRNECFKVSYVIYLSEAKH